ncbi:hypothetical protein GCM10011390_44520 [Aureimonas endophytica]|uniref:Uncharacterized protein n=1 Tax=Aureimonas endophytica TaxID=2027858 RepID=A0A917A0T4_9HYPH|nr:hypothetical protein [Aureimonas endophytica]GGE20353.1 hypothetical protein GCM10011390_44520 [Aureimonas endophytica]
MTATEAIRAVETCAITEAEALRRTGATTMVALYRMAILELAPHLRDHRGETAGASRKAAKAA